MWNLSKKELEVFGTSGFFIFSRTDNVTQFGAVAGFGTVLADDVAEIKV